MKKNKNTDTSKDIAKKSKTAKHFTTIKEPVPRFFESINQIQGYWSEGEYDLVSIFKFLKYESYFMQATFKKMYAITKGGYSIHSDDDDVKEYFTSRFTMMGLQTGFNIKHLIEQLAYYLVICSNAFLIKVRDEEFEYADSYIKDNKEMYPITGLFAAHPTQMKPRFQWVPYKDGIQVKHKIELTAWIFVNRRGIMREFHPDDVAHFFLHREDGMIFGTPQIIPVIDDIKTFRKMEEDSELLVYRDLFPLLHYKIEKPGIIDHTTETTEIDQAKRDMERMQQDGGIVTDSRHVIEYVGSEGKHLDLQPYLLHFENRVLAGLGITRSDMGLESEQAQTSPSRALISEARFIQQELTKQFDELILSEMCLQSPFGIEGLREGKKPTLKFEEIDLEWQIRKENHHADQFTKGVLTVDEVRDPRGLKSLDNSSLQRTFNKLYNNNEGMGAGKSTALKKKPDLVKASGTTSNIVKGKNIKHHDGEDFILNDVDLTLSFNDVMSLLTDISPTGKKFNIKAHVHNIYQTIKERITTQFINGIKDFTEEDDVTLSDSENIILNTLHDSVDILCNDVIDSLYKDKDYIRKAATRISTTNRTEQVKAYNIGYCICALANNKNKFNLVDYSNQDTVVDTITLDKFNIKKIPPYHPNQKLIVKAI